MGDKDRRDRDRLNLKRPPPLDQERDGRGGRDELRFRLLVGVKKAGSVIGKGGDFIQMTKNMTGARVGVDKAIGSYEERLVHVSGVDEPDKPLAGVQEAVLRTAERIMGEETTNGPIKLPHKCTLRMLLYKFQIGAVMGKKGAAINEVRNKSGASVKLVTPDRGVPLVPCAEPDDELLLLSGTPEQTLTALKMVSDKLRAAPMPPAMDRSDRDRGPPGDRDVKRSRGPGPDHHRPDGPPPGWDVPPPVDARGPPPDPRGAPPVHGPPPGAISLALPYTARGVLANNDSVKTEGLTGLATVEYRILVPVRKSHVILGNKGQLIKEIRSRTGARVHLFEEDKGCPDRILQVMSTEDVQDQHCAAFDAGMDCITALLQEEAQSPNQGMTVRIILPHPQVGAVMGKGGSTIKALRDVSGSAIHLSAYPDVPRCVKKGEEVMEMRGTRESVLLASHVALVAIRGNMARGQLIYKHPTPHGAPPPTPRQRGLPPGTPLGLPNDNFGPPPGYHGYPSILSGPPSTGRGGPHHHDPRNGAHISGGPLRSRWDSDSRGVPALSGHPPSSSGPSDPRAAAQQQQQGPPAAGNPPAAPQSAGAAPAGSAAAVGGYVQQQQQQHAPQQHVQYVQQQPGAPQQVVVYTNQPPPSYVPTATVQQPSASSQPVVEYVVQQPPVQVHVPPSVGATSQPMVVYGQPPQVIDPQHMPQQQIVTHTQIGPDGQPRQVTYIYSAAPAQAPAAAAPAAAPPAAAPAAAAAPPAAPAAGSVSGPSSTSGYGGLAGLVGALAAAVPAPAPPKARVLLTQEQVERLQLNDPGKTAQLSALSGATITLSENILEHGAREVLLSGSDAQCNTAKNLMEALMRSA